MRTEGSGTWVSKLRANLVLLGPHQWAHTVEWQLSEQPFPCIAPPLPLGLRTQEFIGNEKARGEGGVRELIVETAIQIWLSLSQGQSLPDICMFDNQERLMDVVCA